MQNDEKLAKQKAIDDWLPITSARNAKWWYSAFHNVTAMVGAGVLGLPYAMAQLGWYVYIIISLDIKCFINCILGDQHRDISVFFFFKIKWKFTHMH